MKKITFTAIALGILFLQSFRYLGVPEIILTAFQQHYPFALDIEWDHQGIYYHVEFETKKDLDHDIWYNGSGEEVKHKSEIQAHELPETIKQLVHQKHPHYRIDDIEKIVEMGETYYDIEIENLMGSEIEMMIKASGEIISEYPD